MNHWQKAYTNERTAIKRLQLMAQLSDHVYYPLAEAPERHHALLDATIHDVTSEDGHDLCRLFEKEGEIICVFSGTREGVKHQHKRNHDTGYKLPLRRKTPNMIGGMFDQDDLCHPGYIKTLFGSPPTYDSLPEGSFAQAIINKINGLDPEHDKHISLAGHSAGGAMAVLMAAYLAEKKPELTPTDVNSFGAPRFANSAFHEALAAKGVTYRRCELLNDPVTSWPPQKEGYYEHGGKQFVLDLQGSLRKNCEAKQHAFDTFSYRLPGVILNYIGTNRRTEGLYTPHRSDSYIDALRLQSGGISPTAAKHLAHPRSMPTPAEAAEKIFRWSEGAAHQIEARIADQTGKTAENIQEPLNRLKQELGGYAFADDKEQWINRIVNTIPELYMAIKDSGLFDDKILLPFQSQLIELSDYINTARAEVVEMEAPKKGLRPVFAK